MDVDLLYEIKSLNTAMIKRLFSMKNKSNTKIHPKPLQFEILEFLNRNKDKNIYQKDLEKKFKISKAAISGVLNTMEKNNMILRVQSETDARKNKIILTKNSKKLHKELMYHRKQLNEEILKGISLEELEQFLKIIEKIKESMKEEGEN